MHKAVGVAFILLGCIGWGSLQIGKERERIRHLHALCRILLRICSEIGYGRHTLPEICQLLSQERESDYSCYFKRIYEKTALEGAASFPGQWEAQMASCLEKLPLREDEREVFISLPDRLGFPEERGQAESIGQAGEFLAARCRQAEEAWGDRSKMIRSVSILAGLLLTILLL